MYKNWINAILGFFLIGVSFVDLSATALTLTLSVVGVALIINSAWSTLIGSERKDYRRDIQAQP